MSVSNSPSNPISGDVVALRMTRTVNATTVEVDHPEYRLTSVPPGSKLRKNELLARVANPTGTVLAATTNTARAFYTNLAETAGYWLDAELRFTSGPNSGRAVRVETFSSGTVGVAEGLVEAPNAGDSFTLEHEAKRRLSFSPDVSGSYVLSCAIYREWSAPPSFDGDPGGATYRTLVSTENKTVYVGTVADLPIRAEGGFGITLRLKAHNGTVTAAELVDPLTRDDYLASKDSTVATKLAALVDEPTNTLGPDLPAVMNTLATEYNDHRILTAGSVHSAADTTNAYANDRPYDMGNALVALNRLRQILVAHLTGASTAGTRWHAADDTKNVPVASPATSLAQAMALYADLAWRCYNRHRTQTAAPASHGASDNTNTIGSIDRLSDLIVAYLDFIADDAPSVPTGAEAAEVQLASLYGFTVAD